MPSSASTFKLTAAVGSKTFHPYSGFLPVDVGTGDGIAVGMQEHFGAAAMKQIWKNVSYKSFQDAADKARTAPHWGVRTHSRLMHDGNSLALTDAIPRHKGEAQDVTEKFDQLNPKEKAVLLAFPDSL